MKQSKEARFLHGLNAMVSSGKMDEINRKLWEAYYNTERCN